MLISLFSNVHSFNQKLTLTHQQMTTDYEKLRQEETDKSSKLQELMSVPPNNKNCYQSIKNNKHNVSSSPLSASSPHTSPSRIVNCLSPKKQQNCANSDNMLLDEFDIDEQNLNKIRKNFFNTQCQHHTVNDDDSFTHIDNVYTMDKHHHDNEPHSQHHQNSKSLLSTLCRTIPLALPTLQLHLLISLTMVLLTHRCPQYLIVL